MTLTKVYRPALPVIFVLVISLLSGCQTTNPYTGEQELNKTATYGGMGALAGAVIGGIVV